MGKINITEKIHPNIPSKANNKYLECLDPLNTYDIICIGFSGGKDSIAATLHLLDIGVPKERILLLHHLIDGEKENDTLNMDWTCTKDYCKKFAQKMGLKIKFSWREEGFIGEILRIGASKPVCFEELTEEETSRHFTRGWKLTEVLNEKIEEATLMKDYKSLKFYEDELRKLGYRYKFPAKSGNLNTRWCSSALKIEVCDRIFRYSNLTKDNIRILFIDGVRREESSNRAKYNEMEIHTTHAPTKGRIVHHWRPIIDWEVEKVWNIIEKYNINAHPCYHIGWSRCSCAACIFSLPCHMKGLKEVNPKLFDSLVQLEKKLNFTIDNKKDINEYISKCDSCVPKDVNEFYIEQSKANIISEEYFNKKWELPNAAFLSSEGGPC